MEWLQFAIVVLILVMIFSVCGYLMNRDNSGG